MSENTNGTTTSAPINPTVKTAFCIVSHDSRWVEIENEATGKYLRLTLTGSQEWDHFGGLDGELIRKLRSVRIPNTLTLTATEMKMFAALCRGESYDPFAQQTATPPVVVASVPQAEDNGADEIENTDPTPPVVPVVPVIVPSCPSHGPMVRMSSNTGWRCSQAGRWNGRLRRWTGCEYHQFDNPRPAVSPVNTPPVVQVAPPTVVATVKANASNGTASAGKVLNRIAPQDAHDEALTTASLDGAEARLAGLRSVLENIPEDGYVLLIYDIPDALQKECPNPCRILWPHGFPVNLSGRIMRADKMGHPVVTELFALWDEHSTERYGYDNDGRPMGVEYYAIPIPMMTEQLKQLCRQKIDRELIRLHRALIKNIASADDKLAALIGAEETTAQQVEDGEDARNNKVRANIRKATEGLLATIACAEEFDEKGNLLDLFKGLREVIACQATLFNERVRGLREIRKGVPIPPPVA